MADITLKLTNRSAKAPVKGLPPSIDLPGDATVDDAKKAIARKTRTSDHNRIGLFDPDTKKTLKDHKAKLQDLDYDVLLVKDLGPQIAWETVYVIEYFGPLLFHPIALGLRSYIYPAIYPYVQDYVPKPNAGDALSTAQQITFACVMAHFVKRELETLFVHRFALTTMPLFNVFRNSFFYWAVAGLLAAFEVYAPWSFAARADNPVLIGVGLLVFFFGEAANATVHYYLSTLRSPGGTEKKIPYGYGFGLVTSPNYMYEIIAWIGVILISRSPSLALFISIGAYYMYIWGWGKEKDYRREFGDKYKRKRYVMFYGIA